MEVIVTYILVISINHWGGDSAQLVPPEPFTSRDSCAIAAEALSELLHARFPDIHPLVEFECRQIEPVVVPLVR